VTFLISSIQKDILPESTSQAKQTILKKNPTHLTLFLAEKRKAGDMYYVAKLKGSQG